MEIPLPTRPVRADDGPRFCRLWSRLSRETVYRRFHAPLHRPPSDALPHLVGVDHDLREALVAVVGDEVVGVARYDRPATAPGTAEVAVVVEDAWQGAGVGRQLLRDLLDLAGRRGVTTVTADVQADNDRVVGLVRRLLPGATLTPADGVYAVTAPLPRVPALAGT
ncbi:GNAT family N-acetyltransferase [Geodermatophilus sabuli]|uniref:Acetyltransferase (GNAT) family protein n=1 Tax=Geodermatophilus sabuli TaxID=1564158 RepID=A0A285EHM8_9ACTN|nr:GNAT family N-acetyltransferase [Geodermatophilus sabuli]MBB3083846.1 GNAT superfamily N-acetyltransferase [Geodermatophilus sabuli]SNX98497.1 Acetyltransferase (GNAT) family protein [Geodermatophilus sabuli]